MKGLVLIPAYNPSNDLIKLVETLSNKDLNILVVDDGSGNAFSDIFEKVKQVATVISYDKNVGKGHALKTGIRYVKENCPDVDYFITADSDGQHTPEDIIRVKQRLENGERIVLTTRNLNRKCPLRSNIGNMLSRFIYTMLTGKYYADNQSGLRGFATSECDWLLSVKGEHYDYELNVIYYADKQRLKICTLDISVVYIDGNSSSHFNPVKDTLRIYKQLFTSAMGSIMAMLLIELVVLFSPLYLTSITASKHFIATIPLFGLFMVLISHTLSRFIFLKNIKINDGYSVIIRTMIRHIIYTALSYGLFLLAPQLTVCVIYNLVLVLLIVPEYLILKLYYVIKNRKNKN